MGVSYLLDTHILVWLTGRERPPYRDPVREALEDLANEVLVSSVSAFEVATKVRLGKFESARQLADRWETAVRDFGARSLPVDDNAALLAGRLDWAHRDPFDRLLAAQAISNGLTLVTSDRVFASAPGVSVLPW